MGQILFSTLHLSLAVLVALIFFVQQSSALSISPPFPTELETLIFFAPQFVVLLILLPFLVVHVTPAFASSPSLFQVEFVSPSLVSLIPLSAFGILPRALLLLLHWLW